jgi:hypothetical protein
MISPADGSSVAQGTAVALQAQAVDTDGSVQRVEFYAGMTKVGESTAAPYVATWTASVAGSQVFSAIAYDNNGAASAASSVTVTVMPGTGGPTTLTIRRGNGSATTIADTYLSSYSMNRNYGGAESLLELSQYNILLRAAIFHSEGGPVPNGATIEAASLSVYKWTSYAMTYGLHRVLHPWTESGATWNQREAGVGWSAPGGKVADGDYAAVAEATATVGYDAGWLNFDVTAHVQSLSHSVVTVNHGWRLHPVAGSTSALKRFYSSEYAADPQLRPKLVIMYR